MNTLSTEEIIEKFENLRSGKKVDILLNALGLMSSCNSQSEDAVIVKSMGYTSIGDNMWKKVTSQAKRND